MDDAGPQRQSVHEFFTAFQSEALALVQQKALTREDCSSLVSSFARIAADNAEQANPRPCHACDGNDCERCGGTGFYCVSCPTYSRAADIWQALLHNARADGADAAYKEAMAARDLLMDQARAGADREATKRMQIGSDMVLDAYKAHHAAFHPECNITGPPAPPCSRWPIGR